MFSLPTIVAPVLPNRNRPSRLHPDATANYTRTRTSCRHHEFCCKNTSPSLVQLEWHLRMVANIFQTVFSHRHSPTRRCGWSPAVVRKCAQEPHSTPFVPAGELLGRERMIDCLEAPDLIIGNEMLRVCNHSSALYASDRWLSECKTKIRVLST